MNKKLDLVIVDALKMIIGETEHDVTYNIHKAIEKPNFKKQKQEVIRVEVVLTKNVE